MSFYCILITHWHHRVSISNTLCSSWLWQLLSHYSRLSVARHSLGLSELRHTRYVLLCLPLMGKVQYSRSRYKQGLGSFFSCFTMPLLALISVSSYYELDVSCDIWMVFCWNELWVKPPSGEDIGKTLQSSGVGMSTALAAFSLMCWRHSE